MSALGAQGEHPTGLRRLFSMASGTLVLQVCAFGGSFAISLLLARFLGKSGYGIYALANSWTTLLAFPAILGFDRYLLRGLAVYQERQEWPLGRGLLVRTNQLVTGASLLVACVAAVVCGALCSPELRLPMAIAMLMIPINNLVQLRQGAMQAMRRVVRGQIPEFVIRPWLIVLLIIAAHALVPTSFTPVFAIAIAVVATTVAFVVGAVWLVRILPDQLKTADPTYRTRAWLRSAIPMMLVVSVNLINNQISVLLVGGIAGHRSAGVFSVAEAGGTITGLVLYACLMPLSPELARLSARGDLPRMEHVARRVAQWAVIGSIPVAAAFTIAPEFFLSLFGPGFAKGATAMTMLSLVQVVNAAAGPCGMVLIMSGHERLATIGVGFGLVSNVAFSAVFIPILGVTGGAIGEATSMVVWNAVMVFLVLRTLRINSGAFGPRLRRSE